MPLFGGSRDMSLFRHLNRELINDIIDIRVDIFKASLANTKENLYGEALRKQYFPSVRMACIVDLQDEEVTSDEFGPEIDQQISFNFLRDDLKDVANLVIEIGDIIHWNSSYWEVDESHDDEKFMRRDEEDNKVDLGDNWGGDDGSGWGWSNSVIVKAHKTRKSSLTLERVRAGIPKNI
jgi:hypothetical protein